MAKIKSVFIGFTEDEVFKAESVLYVVQVGSDFYKGNDSYTFNKRAAAVNYNKALNEILDMMDGGNKKEKKEAHNLMQNLRLYPLRLH